MNRQTKYLGVPTVVLAILMLGSCVGWGQYDGHTRKRVSKMVQKELPVGASFAEMEAFMKRHTTRYGVDETFNREIGGFLEQTDWDRRFFFRQVKITLKFDENRRLKSSEVSISYTTI